SACPVFQKRGSEMVISEAARPAPRRLHSSRNGLSVTPAIGASTTPGSIVYGPIRIAARSAREAGQHLVVARHRRGRAGVFGRQRGEAVGVTDVGGEGLLRRAGQGRGQGAVEGIAGAGGVAGGDALGADAVVGVRVAPHL